MSAMGYLDRREGEIKSNGSIAYVPQTAFLLNNTLQENILFGKKFNQSKYKKTLESCRLVDVSDHNFYLKFFRIWKHSSEET